MERSISPYSIKLSSLLTGTRIVKKFVKRATKIHSRLETEYKKLFNTCDSSKCPNFKETFESHISYTKSFLEFNKNVINSTRTSYESLKRSTLEIKSKMEILKAEKKSLKRMKSDNLNENSKEIIFRCENLVKCTTECVENSVKQAIQNHLFSLKSLKSKVLCKKSASRESTPPNPNYFFTNKDFEDQLEESLKHKRSYLDKSEKKIQTFKNCIEKNEEASSLGMSLKYHEDLSSLFYR